MQHEISEPMNSYEFYRKFQHLQHQAFLFQEMIKFLEEKTSGQVGTGHSQISLREFFLQWKEKERVLNSESKESQNV